MGRSAVCGEVRAVCGRSVGPRVQTAGKEEGGRMEGGGGGGGGQREGGRPRRKRREKG